MGHHRHEPAEIYNIFTGAGVVTIDGTQKVRYFVAKSSRSGSAYRRGPEGEPRCRL
jgi:hypothetical protein